MARTAAPAPALFSASCDDDAVWPASFPPPGTLSDGLLAWYDRDGRSLPWRSRPGSAPADPYHVWLSEIMLQQTTVQAVIPYFQDFLARWPTVTALAEAPEEDVLARWAGLGYYARARNLIKCAQTVAQWREGHFPDTEAELLTLPGVGAYTAAAIAAIAFGRSAVVVDGNVERVMARLFNESDPLPAVKPRLKLRAASLTPPDRAGDYAQGVMDLGATLCTPRKPACGLCPWRDPCLGRRAGTAESLPAKAPKKEKPTRRGVAFWITRPDGRVLLRRRPPEGLLGGMMEIPSTDWSEAPPPPAEEAARLAPLPLTRWTALPGAVRHTFTHFHLELTLLAGEARFSDHTRGIWVPREEVLDKGLPTVMAKIARLALSRKRGS